MSTHEPLGYDSDVSAGTDRTAAAFRDHWAMIRGAALRSTRDPDVAADIAQDAFLRLVTEGNAGRFPDNVSAWLYRTSTNLVISRARRAAVARRSEAALVRRDLPAEPHAIASMRERSADLGRALSRIPSAERMALLLAAEGATGGEMAAKVGRTRGATRTLLCRARMHLRAGLADIEAGSSERRPAARSREPEPGLAA